MCRHQPERLYHEPTDFDGRLAYLLRHLGSRYWCPKCGLTATLTSFGHLRWHYEGTVGWLGRAREVERAAEWNKRYGNPGDGG